MDKKNNLFPKNTNQNKTKISEEDLKDSKQSELSKLLQNSKQLNVYNKNIRKKLKNQKNNEQNVTNIFKKIIKTNPEGLNTQNLNEKDIEISKLLNLYNNTLKILGENNKDKKIKEINLENIEKLDLKDGNDLLNYLSDIKALLRLIKKISKLIKTNYNLTNEKELETAEKSLKDLKNKIFNQEYKLKWYLEYLNPNFNTTNMNTYKNILNKTKNIKNLNNNFKNILDTLSKQKDNDSSSDSSFEMQDNCLDKNLFEYNNNSLDEENDNKIEDDLLKNSNTDDLNAFLEGIN